MQPRRLFLLLICGLLALWPAACAPATAPAVWDLVLAAPAGYAADAAQAAADAYAQSTGLRVEVQALPGDAYASEVLAVLLAGTGKFDLIYLSAESLPKWAGYHTLQPVDLTGDENTAPWLPLATVDGDAMGVPVDPDVDVLWYRADVFEAAGVEVPRDLDAFAGVLDTLKQAQKTMPLAISAGELDAGRDLAALLGPESLIEQHDTGSRVNLQALREALSFYHGARENPRLLVDPNSANWSRADVQRSLATGQAAIGILPLSAARELLDCERSPDVCKDGKPLLAFAPLPGMEDTLGVASVQAWAVPLKASHPETAQAFAAWLASEEGARAWTSGGGLPAHRGVLAEIDSPAARALAEIETARPAFPPLIPAGDTWRALHIAGHGAAEGEPVEQLLKEMERSIEAALRQSGYTVIE